MLFAWGLPEGVMERLSANDLLVRLSHELASSLEVNHRADELSSPLHADAVDALAETTHLLRGLGIPVSDVVQNVLKVANRHVEQTSEGPM